MMHEALWHTIPINLCTRNPFILQVRVVGGLGGLGADDEMGFLSEILQRSSSGAREHARGPCGSWDADSHTLPTPTKGEDELKMCAAP